MGILNVTPDSFSDGGLFVSVAAAIAQAERLVADGADLIDIGGESTRPGAPPVPEQEELDRVIPVVEQLKARCDVPVSIDTFKPAVMRAAVAAGADLINDVRALSEPGALTCAAELGVPVCLMHMQGRPGDMQRAPAYTDVVGEVLGFLRERRAAAIAAGVASRDILLDPGFGFGKTLAHNLALFEALPRFAAEGPLLVGVSRKRMIGALLGDDALDRTVGSVTAALAAAQLGAHVLRVHDVARTVQALRVWAGLHGDR